MNKKSLLLLISGIFAFTSCNKTNNNSSEQKEFVSLSQAIENTQYYNIYSTPSELIQSDFYSYVEIYSETDYCKISDTIGNIILDDDPGFTHQFSVSLNDEYNTMLMYGRVGGADYLKEYVEEQLKFIDIIDYYKDFFIVNNSDKSLYQFYGNEIANIFYRFFELKSISYCNYFEMRIGENGRIAEFNCGETYAEDRSDLIITFSFSLEEGGIKNTYLYPDWVNNNKPTEVRIYDYKSTYFNGINFLSCYESANITATVTSIDLDGSFYVSNNDKYTGPVGMKVFKSSSSTYVPKINDIVNISGQISLTTDVYDKEAYSPYLDNAEVNKVGESFYTPIYSEESLVDQNGAGIYAAYLLSLNPVFSASLYTGFAYVNKPITNVDTSKDVVIELICPSFESDSLGTLFTMNLIIPSAIGEEKINSILDEIDNLGYYQELGEEAKLLMMKDCIYYFDFEKNFDSKLGANIYVNEYSTISHRLSFNEMLEKEYSMYDFPLVENDESIIEQPVSFHFGHASGFYLETFYGSDETNGNGLFYQAGCSVANMNSYLQTIESYPNINFIDAYRISISSGFIHYVYQYNDVYIDVVLNVTSNLLQLFIYRNDTMIRSKTINEKIDQYCSSFFDSDEFIKLDGTYDYNYQLYRLSSYAGHIFTEDNKLTVATMDLNTDRFQELRTAYREIGYKQYREDINDSTSKVYSYVTRGVSHYVYYKENENGKYTFLDFAQYPTSDYTFVNHSSFSYRVEILIYEGNEPMSTLYTDDLTNFISLCVSEVGRFEWKLPSQYKAEIYYQDENSQSKIIDYGYTFNTDAFIYPSSISDLDNLYNYCISVFEQNGFEFSYTGKKGVCYVYKKDPNEQYGFAVYIMKDSSRGFVRIINSIGGIDF